MDVMFHLLLLITVTSATPNTYCGQCDCYPKLSYPPVYMICQGLHVTAFPDTSFDLAEHLREIHLYSTLITELPTSDPGKFMRLESVSEQSNSLLDCATVKAWQQDMPYCTFDSDCLNATLITTLATTVTSISTSEEIPHVNEPSNALMINILLAIAVISLAVVSVAMAPCRGRRRRGRRWGARYPRGPCQCSDDVSDRRSPSAPPTEENTSFEMGEFSSITNENLYEME